MTSYKVLDNGGRPFRVVVDENSIVVYLHYNNKKAVWRQDHPKHVFVGEDPHSEAKDKDAGNSVLVKVDEHNYVFIGPTIYSFKTTDEIKSFVSPIGNSDVSYPYAIGTEFVYLLIEDVFFPVKQFEPYGLHYGHKPRASKLTKTVIHKRLY